MPTQRAFAAALLDPAAPVPAGLTAWNGSDVRQRFAVYRNNVVTSLLGVLRDTFPVVRELVGDEFFSAMGRLYLCDHPPRSPVMSEFGASFAAWVADFEPATALPYLAEVAQLEFARLCSLHAADAPGIAPAELAAALADPHALAATVLTLHPSAQVLRFDHAAVSMWHAHQLAEAARDAALAAVDVHAAESALVLRGPDDEVLVVPLVPADAGLLDALRCGQPLGAAAACHPGADLTRVVAALLQRRAVVDLRAGNAMFASGGMPRDAANGTHPGAVASRLPPRVSP
ncbi:MAG: putative DNA-binding domain-containing protein [Rubrivivax sp.]|nr:putative DNA-binding domain-containing protein [Rubrivivax sp.]